LAYSTDGFNWIENVLSGILRGVSWSNELSLFLVSGNNQLYTSSFKNRQPTNHNIFDSEFISINENGEWTFKSLTATTIKGTKLIYGEDIDVEEAIGDKQDIITDGSLSITKTLNLQTTLNQKQDILQAGTGIDITNNVISSTSTSSFVGFRAVTAQGTDLNISINTVIPFNSVSVNTFAYDTENMFDTTASSYTIPTGYSGYWVFNMNLFIAEYAETFRRVHLRITRGSSNFEPCQVGNYNTQINALNGTIPCLEGDIIRMFVSNGGTIRIYGQQFNCRFEGRYLG
jgi:hypothetical protein